MEWAIMALGGNETYLVLPSVLYSLTFILCMDKHAHDKYG